MRVLLAIPLIFILVVFALSNKQDVRLGLWPTDISIALPVSIAVLGIAALFFIAGGLMVWGGALSQRSRARRAEAAVRRLEMQVEAMRARPVVSVPGASVSVASLPPPG